MPAVDTMSEPLVVTSRPIRTSRIAWTVSAVILIVFIVVAVLQKRDNAGAWFTDSDQIGTAVIGVILAGLAIMPTRPRLVADASGLRLRAYLGGWRTVPWDLVVRVDFPRKLRFARIVLPGDESLAIYAVQRADREQAVAVMAQLRELWAQTHPAHPGGMPRLPGSD